MIAGLFLFLVLAVMLDIRTYRIPNALTMAGMAVGVIYQLYRAGPPGMFRAVMDLAGSILIMFPLYMIRCLGAGDIKLLSVISIFLGWKRGMIISIYSLFAGALLGIAKRCILFALRQKKITDQKVFIKQKSIKTLRKEVYFHSAGKTAKSAFLEDKEIKREVNDLSQKKLYGSLGLLRQTKTEKNRQKERDHIEQIRTANQQMISNKRIISNKGNQGNKTDQIGEINQNYYCLNQRNRSNLWKYYGQKIQLSITSQIRYFKSFIRKKQMRQKQEAGDQRCVIHYSVAILIAFLVAQMN